MAYDAARQRVVLFGGVGIGGFLGDTWEWDGINWGQRAPASSPSARCLHAMAYDAARQRVVLFGGSATSLYLGDTWVWDGTTWMQLVPASSPSGREDHAMAYDAARQRVVLFGGSSWHGDTWEWDGINWGQRAPASSPSARISHRMAYDAARQRVVLFGGWNGSSNLGDTWEWDGINWVLRVPASSPSARGYHAMAYDAARQRVVLFGGSPSGGLLGDTWEWDGTNWMQLTPPASPPTTSGHAMAPDASQRMLLLRYGETWVLGAPGSMAGATTFGNGCGSPALGFVPDPNGRPILGQSGRATIVNAPTPVAAVALGWSNQTVGPVALPMTLAGIGMPGCDLQQSSEVLGLGTSPLTPSTLAFSLPIPNAPSFVGLHVYLQAYAFAPGVNPLQIIISNGIDWIFGNV